MAPALFLKGDPERVILPIELSPDGADVPPLLVNHLFGWPPNRVARMVEAVRATKSQQANPLDRLSGLLDGRKLLAVLTEYALPCLMAALIVFSLAVTLQRAGALRDWSEDYSPGGEFVVESCVPVSRFSADHWNCSGRFVGDGASQELRTSLITSMNARSSDRPYVGQRLDAFHAVGDRSSVYPVAYRLNELTRLYLSLIPRLFLLVGSVIWLAGWALTRSVDSEDFVARDTIRLPQRFGWKNRGLVWISVAALVLVFNYYLTTRIIGSLGIL